MNRPLILASTSPRRQSLLAELGIPFTISAPTLEQETLDPALPLAEALEHLALEKARSVARDNPQALVLGADTIVCKDDALLGKPRDAAHAAQMLRTLSGAEHQVITAVALTCAESQKSITRALGPDPAVEADGFPLQWKPGDFLLLCSDGLVNTVTDQEIMFEILHNGQPEGCLQRLMAISKQRGAPDNVTAILLMND